MKRAAAASSLSALSRLPPPHPLRRSVDRAGDGQHWREVAWKALPVIAAVRAGEELAVARADVYAFRIEAVCVQPLAIDALVAVRAGQTFGERLTCPRKLVQSL